MEYNNLFKVFNTFQAYYTELLQSDIPELHGEYNNMEVCIKKYYKDNCRVVYHISEKTDLRVIKPTSNYDMYGIKFSDRVFATSNPYEIWLYACRATSGEMHEKNRICIYPNNPFSYYKAGYYYLKRNVAIYMLDVEKFFPVLNRRTQMNMGGIYFDNEWISKEEVVPKYKHVINRIPEGFTKYYSVYFLKNDGGTEYPNTSEELQYYIEKNMIQKI